MVSSETRVSKGFLTVVPKSVRTAAEVQEGDVLSWTTEGDRIIVTHRKRATLQQVTGMLSHGGDAVVAKRKVQRGAR